MKMSNNSNRLFSLFATFLLLSTAAAQAPTLVQSQKPAPRLPKPILTHLRFYWHDVISGRDPTSIQIADAPSTNSSATGFGFVNMIDNPLTLGPSLTSETVGRAQGFYASSDKEVTGLLMTMTLVFTEGRFNGSTIGIVGRNSVATPVREMAVVGGTGAFRLARGFCNLRTHWVDAKSHDACVKYDVFVRHY